MKNGVVINKWADISVPAEEDLHRPLDEMPYGQMIDIKDQNKKNLFYTSAIFLLPLLLLKGLDFLVYRNRKKIIPQTESKNDEE